MTPGLLIANRGEAARGVVCADANMRPSPPDPAERQQAFRCMLAGAHQSDRNLNMASKLEIDSVIDRALSCCWPIRGRDRLSPPQPRDGRKRSLIDTGQRPYGARTSSLSTTAPQRGDSP
jgi:hypothetical protein